MEAKSEILPEYMSLEDLTDYCSVSISTLRRWLKSGMPHFKFGRSIRVKISDFDAWVERFRSSGTKPISANRQLVQDAWETVSRRNEQ